MTQSIFNRMSRASAIPLTVVAARRLIVAAALASLSGCAAMIAIDNAIDPSRPVMVQGEGAIAASFEYHMPMTEVMRMGRLITDIGLKPMDSSAKKEVWFGTGRAVPNLIAKLPHEKNVTPPIVYMFSLKPGKYRLHQISMGSDYPYMRMFDLDGPVITVVAGQVTYVGNYYIKYDAQFNSKGYLGLTYATVAGPNNQFVRDIGELKSAEKRLENVVITNVFRQ